MSRELEFRADALAAVRKMNAFAFPIESTAGVGVFDSGIVHAGSASFVEFKAPPGWPVRGTSHVFVSTYSLSTSQIAWGRLVQNNGGTALVLARIPTPSGYMYILTDNIVGFNSLTKEQLTAQKTCTRVYTKDGSMFKSPKLSLTLDVLLSWESSKCQ